MKPPLQYSEHYRSGRMETWLKIKCIMRETYTVVGFLPHPGAVGALHLARKEGKDLIYVGKVGTGFSRKVAVELRRLLDPLVIAKAQLSKPLRMKDAVWVRPSVKAEIEYRDVTNDGHLRHASFKKVAGG